MDTAAEFIRLCARHQAEVERYVFMMLQLESFKRQKECFPESAAGLELFDCWILTVEEDAGLEIVSVALY